MVRYNFRVRPLDPFLLRVIESIQETGRRNGLSGSEEGNPRYQKAGTFQAAMEAVPGKFRVIGQTQTVRSSSRTENGHHAISFQNRSGFLGEYFSVLFDEILDFHLFLSRMTPAGGRD